MVYAPGTLETDPKKQNMALQQQASAIKTATDDIATNAADITALQTDVSTLQTDVSTLQADVAVLETPGTGLTGGGGSALAVSLSKITASLGSNVALNNTANYFDGPSVAQGTSGVWFAEGTVTITVPGGATEIYGKLWDGTTVVASTAAPIYTGTAVATISLSGYFSSPAGNIRISCRDVSRTDGSMVFNRTGNSKDCTITAVQIG